MWVSLPHAIAYVMIVASIILAGMFIFG